MSKKLLLTKIKGALLVNIYKKFHEDNLNGFQVKERARFCDKQMDRWPDRQPRQKQYASNPEGGRHKKKSHFEEKKTSDILENEMIVHKITVFQI